MALPVVLAVAWRGWAHRPASPEETNSAIVIGEQESGIDLSQACSKDDLTAVKSLAERYGVNEAGAEGMPLNVAAEHGTVEMVKFLISKGARINVSNGWGRSPIHSAAEGGNLETLKALEAAGADIKQPSGEAFLDELNRTSRQFQPIHLAARSGRLTIVRYLVSRGVDPSVKDANGETPFNYAWVEGHDDPEVIGESCAGVMKYLRSISANCDPAPYSPGR
jgi:ankyrin repeat protein